MLCPLVNLDSAVGPECSSHSVEILGAGTAKVWLVGKSIMWLRHAGRAGEVLGEQHMFPHYFEAGHSSTFLPTHRLTQLASKVVSIDTQRVSFFSLTAVK